MQALFPGVTSSCPGTSTVDLLEASATLWSSPAGPLPDPPIDTKADVLPLGQLAWEDVERLFVRLLETESDIERAALFGLPGQAQQGIDVYGRLIPTLGNSPGEAAGFVSLQSRRIKRPTVAGIEKAAKEFLAEEWADRSARFYYATSASLRDTNLDAAVRTVTDLLNERGIEFVPWGVEDVSERLRGYPRIVDDFFGRAWVEKFCGTDQLTELSRRIPAPQARQLRAALGNLYRGAFRAHGASPTLTSADGLPFMVLDTVPIAAEPELMVKSDRNTEDVTEPHPGEDGFMTPSFVRRRTTRPRRASATVFATETMASRTAADEWMAGARLRLLIGTPGSGKSSFLMFAATDLLSTSPQSAVLQRAHAGALPLWLPFAFLCRHLEESTSNSVTSAVRAWTTQQGGEHTWAIIEPALDDDRVVLLVDGVDEWNDITKADQALGLIESFVAQRNIAATLSARPYALTRLNWTLPWEKAALAPLTHSQQLRLAHRALAEAELETSGTDAVPYSPAAETFLAELEQVPTLAPLITTPLFLCLLAKSWRGEALSPQRFRLFTDLERLLIERHPQMRRRASSATGSEFPTTQMLTVLRGVAYRTRLETSSTLATRPQMEQWFCDELAAPDGLGYPPPEATRIAHALLSQAEDEYGLLVPQGIGMVGFLHRVFLDQLAGEHLATRAPEEISASLREHAADPNWRDILITALSAQVSTHVNAAILEEFVADLTIESVEKWELVATAIATGVAISQTALSAWVDEIIARTAEHHDGAHRAELARSLVGMTRLPGIRARLLPVFSRWLSASHPEPASPIWALRDPLADDGEALAVLLWGLRHEDENVQLNAAQALASRFVGDTMVKTRLIDRIRAGATSIHQAFALLSLGTGWPDASELPSLIQWARAQPTFELRICALHLAATDDAAIEVTEDEQRWLQDFLRRERLRPHEPWMHLAMPFIVQAVQAQPGVRAFVLDTLANNGRNGGNRYLAWYLACTTFSDDIAIRDWAAGELGDPEQRGLILYNLSLIPEDWRADPDFVRSLSVTVRRDAVNTPHTADVIGLSTSMREDEAIEALLPALDSFRPAAVAFALLERFGEDPRAIDPIKTRLNGDYETAAKLAPLALTALGTSAGFDRLVELLRSEGRRSDGEDRVVIAQAVAEAWVTLHRDKDDAAAEVLGRYDEGELAARCTAVGTGMLTWHVGSVITAWPAQPTVMEFALEALRHPRSLTRGIMDPTPAAILRAYAPRADHASQEMVTAVMDQLGYLPPDTREVLTVALTESDLSPTALIELLGDWDYDPDIWVQRAAITGLVRRYHRYRLSAGADTSQIDNTGSWLREQVRAQLCAYGLDYEDRRQNAWVAMLLLGELVLHDGLLENIGKPTRPGVELAHVFSGVDLEFVDLLNANWDSLTEHFGEDELFRLLSGVRTNEGEDELRAARHKVLLQLARAPSLHPRVHDLIVTAAESDSTFRSDPSFLIWSHRNGRKDAALLEACLNAVCTYRFNERPSGLYEILVDENAWDVSDTALRELIGGEHRLETSEARSLFAERFPTHHVTRSWYSELEEWFRTDGPRDPRQWRETLTLAVSASPADVLPTIIERAYEQLHLLEIPEMFGDLIAPLLRRLRCDHEAVAQINAAMRDPFAARAETPLWQTQGAHHPPTPDIAARLSYVHARSLQRAGMLTSDDGVEIRSTLLKTGAEVVAHDPFLGVEASLRSLSGVLTRQR